MKCELKDSVLEVEPYKDGLEDGFHRLSMYCGYCYNNFSCKNQCGLGEPYVWASHREQIPIREGDYICQGIMNRKLVISKEDFEKYFKVIE